MAHAADWRRAGWRRAGWRRARRHNFHHGQQADCASRVCISCYGAWISNRHADFVCSTNVPASHGTSSNSARMAAASTNKAAARRMAAAAAAAATPTPTTTHTTTDSTTDALAATTSGHMRVTEIWMVGHLLAGALHA